MFALEATIHLTNNWEYIPGNFENKHASTPLPHRVSDLTQWAFLTKVHFLTRSVYFCVDLDGVTLMGFTVFKEIILWDYYLSRRGLENSAMSLMS